MIESKTIILCADDFGLTPGISQGILKLVRMQRLSALSCMTNAPHFLAHAHELSSLANKVQIGLHFNLTEGHFLSEPDKPCFALNELLIKTHLRALQLFFVAKEFNAQLDQFIKIMGKFPDFIDGHQHVHQFPVIRQMILAIYEQRLRAHAVFIRSTWPQINLAKYQLKAKILAITGGKALRMQLKKLAIPHNPYFAGIYDFSPLTDYRTLFRHWLELAPAHTLIMCHPGEGISSIDAIAPARLLEMDYFLSNEFLEDCNEYRIKLVLPESNPAFSRLNYLHAQNLERIKL